MIKRQFELTIVFLAYALSAWCQNPGYSNDLYTCPERTQYEETSLHVDVIRFVEAPAASSELVHHETIGASFNGNDDLGPNNRPNQDGSPYLAIGIYFVRIMLGDQNITRKFIVRLLE